MKNYFYNTTDVFSEWVSCEIRHVRYPCFLRNKPEDSFIACIKKKKLTWFDREDGEFNIIRFCNWRSVADNRPSSLGRAGSRVGCLDIDDEDDSHRYITFRCRECIVQCAFHSSSETVVAWCLGGTKWAGPDSDTLHSYRFLRATMTIDVTLYAPGLATNHEFIAFPSPIKYRW
ncbi:hypothetical protein CDAR_165521 [Caerostris darwini]|uniref:Uncharacterized protein n=1 Tax=Caerostris darwini TaxID=1538125 RepID=A0AAV4WAP2_9ARAC|nr:hypothetical protein CDAR_165521 [Caerostris darwini]